MIDYPDGCAVIFGASGGLGADVARKMAAAGARLGLVYRSRKDALDPLLDELGGTSGEALVLQCDLREGSSVEAALGRAVEKFGRVHSVVNAAGSFYRYHSVAKTPVEELRHVLETDVVGFLNIARATVPLMRQAGGGAIVTVGTAAVDRTSHGNCLSSVPKSAVAMMVRLLALEEGGRNIRVNMVGAGVYKAGMTLAMQEQAAVGSVSPEDFAKVAVALRRCGEAKEFGGMAAFLCSNAATYITGQIVHVDGGLSV